MPRLVCHSPGDPAWCALTVQVTPSVSLTLLQLFMNPLSDEKLIALQTESKSVPLWYGCHGEGSPSQDALLFRFNISVSDEPGMM